MEHTSEQLEVIARAFRDSMYSGVPCDDKSWAASRVNWMRDAQSFIQKLRDNGFIITEIAKRVVSKNV